MAMALYLYLLLIPDSSLCIFCYSKPFLNNKNTYEWMLLTLIFVCKLDECVNVGSSNNDPCSLVASVYVTCNHKQFMCSYENSIKPMAVHIAYTVATKKDL